MSIRRESEVSWKAGLLFEFLPHAVDRFRVLVDQLGQVPGEMDYSAVSKGITRFEKRLEKVLKLRVELHRLTRKYYVET